MRSLKGATEVQDNARRDDQWVCVCERGILGDFERMSRMKNEEKTVQTERTRFVL